MPDVLRRRHQLRQQQCARTRIALQAPEARACRREEQIVIEEARVDRLRERERVRVRRRAGHGDHADAARIEHTESRVGVVHRHRGDARNIAFDDEHVGRGVVRSAEEGIDCQHRVAGGHEVEIGAARRVGDGELIVRRAIHQRDQPLVLEALQVLKRAHFPHGAAGRRQHRAAVLVAEEIGTAAEEARLLRLEHAARLVDEEVASVGQLHITGDQPRVVDAGAAVAVDIDRQMRLRPDLARVGDRRSVVGVAEGKNASAKLARGIDRARVLDRDRAVWGARNRENAGGIVLGRGGTRSDVAAVRDVDAATAATVLCCDAVGIVVRPDVDLGAVDNADGAARADARRSNAIGRIIPGGGCPDIGAVVDRGGAVVADCIGRDAKDIAGRADRPNIPAVADVERAVHIQGSAQDPILST